ncbi:MAG: hypothetical protein QGI63_01900 [Rhodospirillales bacterium]|nr:hypothetical protein [Rhodospirillales bacterium]MDP6772998.1 hypothetical protein [Rhodospirillales bacterium]
MPVTWVLVCAAAAAACADLGDGLMGGFEQPPKVEIKKSVGIRVEPVDGPPAPMARLLAQSVAAELDTQRVLASVGVAGDSRYVLRGRAERNRDNNRVPFIVVIKWDLVDASGKLVGNHSQGVEGTWWQWEYGDPRIIRSVGKAAAKPIVAMIRVEPDTVPPGAPQPANLLILEVKGALGDGNSALTREMKAAAKAAGIATTELPDVATHVLQGVVRAEAPSGPRQRVTIVWTMTTPDGREVGKATQENTVAAGSLDGAWGPVAALVARAATRGVEDILSRSRQIRAVKSIMPKGRVLPLVPGRAPPPDQ